MAKITCRYRDQALFRRPRCAGADFTAPCDKHWAATDFICKTCRAPQLETVYDCVHFAISAKKEFTDKPDITVTPFCLRKSATKESWNAVKNLSECGTNQSPDRCKWDAYEPHPISEKTNPVMQDSRFYSRPSTSPIPLRLRIWVLLPAILLLTLGIIGLVLRTFHRTLTEQNWNVIEQWIPLTMLSIGLLIGSFAISSFKGNKISLIYCRLLIVLSTISWIFYLYKLFELKQFKWSFNIFEITTLAYLLVSFIITLISLLNKLPQIEALLYPKESEPEPKGVIAWARSHLLKGDIVVCSLIVLVVAGVILSNIKVNSDTRGTSAPASGLAPPPVAPEESKVIVPEGVKANPNTANAGGELKVDKGNKDPAKLIAKAKHGERESLNRKQKALIKYYLETAEAMFKAARYLDAITQYTRILNDIDKDNIAAKAGIDRARSAQAVEDRLKINN